jgi:hypothetical protein
MSAPRWATRFSICDLKISDSKEALADSISQTLETNWVASSPMDGCV